MSEDQEILPKRPRYLYTKEVQDTYGFNPENYMEDIKSSLRVHNCEHGGLCSPRVWLEMDVETVYGRLQREQEEREKNKKTVSWMRYGGKAQ